MKKEWMILPIGLLLISALLLFFFAFRYDSEFSSSESFRSDVLTGSSSGVNLLSGNLSLIAGQSLIRIGSDVRISDSISGVNITMSPENATARGYYDWVSAGVFNQEVIHNVTLTTNNALTSTLIDGKAISANISSDNPSIYSSLFLTDLNNNPISTITMSNNAFQFLVHYRINYGTKDTNDFKFIIDNGAYVFNLPKPSYVTSTQSDWNLGTYINTTANSSGQLILEHGNRSRASPDSSVYINQTGLIEAWSFENNSALGENTSTVNGTFYQYGTVIVNTSITMINSSGKVGKGLYINGANETAGIRGGLDFAARPQYNISITNAFTVAGWFNQQGSQFSSNGAVLIGMGRLPVASQDWFVLGMTTGTNTTVTRLQNGSLQFTQLSAANAMKLNNWTHLALAWNGTNLTLYVNGNPVSSADNKTFGVIGNGRGQLSLTFGRSSAATNPFNGSIDEVIFWNRSLTSAEVSNIFSIQRENFPDNGLYISQVYDSGVATTVWNTLNGTINFTDGARGNISLQVRSCDDASCSGESFVGYDNTTNTFLAFNATLNATLTPNNRYLQYQIIMNTTNRAFTPVVYDNNLTFDNSTGGGGQDTVVPQYYNYSTTPSNNSFYNGSQTVDLRVNINNTNKTNGVEVDGVNYTISNDTFNNYNRSFINFFGVGDHNWYWWSYNGSNSSGALYNISTKQHLYLQKAYPLLSISCPTVEYPNPIACVPVENNLGDGDLTYTQSPSNGVYAAQTLTVNYSTSGGLNYSANSTTTSAIINKNSSQSITHLLNGSSNNVQNATYPSQLNISCSINNAEQTANINLNGSDVTSSNGVYQNLGVAFYTSNCSFSSTQNYTAKSSILTWNLSQGNLSGNVTSSRGFSFEFSDLATVLNFTEPNAGDGGVGYKLLLTFGAVTEDITGGVSRVLVPGTYTLKLNGTGNGNWSDSFTIDIRNVVVSQNSTRASLTQLLDDGNRNVTYGYNPLRGVNSSFNGTNYTGVNFKVNETGLVLTQGVNVTLGVMTSTIIMNETGNQNYSERITYLYAIMTIASNSISCLPNGVASDLSITYSEIPLIYVISNADSGVGNINLNGTTLANGTNYSLGGRTWTVNCSAGSQNFTANSTTRLITVNAGLSEAAARLGGTRNNRTVDNSSTAFNFSGSNITGNSQLTMTVKNSTTTILQNTGLTSISNVTSLQPYANQIIIINVSMAGNENRTADNEWWYLNISLFTASNGTTTVTSAKACGYRLFGLFKNSKPNMGTENCI